MLLMKHNRRENALPEEWRIRKMYPEDRRHDGVRYRYDHRMEPYAYYDERIHGGEPEMRNYRRYSDGRFAPKSSMEYPEYDEYPDYEDEMRPIGFRDDDAYMGDTSYVGDKTHGSERTMGYASSTHTGRMTKDIADEWLHNMQNADGTTGPHWTFEQCKQVMQQHNMNCDPVEFWVAMNAVYSDFCKVNEKHGIRNIDYYVDAACAFWLEDKDAVKNKETAYYRYVVKH